MQRRLIIELSRAHGMFRDTPVAPVILRVFSVFRGPKILSFHRAGGIGIDFGFREIGELLIRVLLILER